MKKYGFFKKLICLGMIFSLTFIGLSGCGQKKTELVNVSYDATREFYKEYNRLFEDYWYGRTGEKVEVIQSLAQFDDPLRTCLDAGAAGGLLTVLVLMLSRLHLRAMLML